VRMWIIDSCGFAVETIDRESFYKMFEDIESRRIAKTDFGQTDHGQIAVSTVFLGFAHDYLDGKPLLYETMVFGGELDGQMRRYATKEEALAGHIETVKDVEHAIALGKRD
jgi:hypothetical protein